MLAAGGYPASYDKGMVITGLDQTHSEDKKTFHAGTADKDGDIVTAGGRVLCATALGEDVATAQAKAYELADTIKWKDMVMRRDIAWRAINR